ncbi:MmcQ/YjbR family DNA-binding protein [Prauserella flavalba]|uniref:MmcQ/YjbR family DNA-binding protein n=1 Tax=Prauserella flavalba TaxID=1477506 RepID=A0A318LV73_9PSEU|nr:MmcQ/YjbR family DNA-binding protein [Prauserella flavalba]PXY38512.1 hypothetical protein BA062_01860 [Prauserella flavalba]
MLGLDDLRAYANALPEVEEKTHFRLPSFAVRGEPFAGLERGETTAIVAVDRETAGAAVAEDPATYEEVWRNAGRPIWVGVRVRLASVPAERLRELVEAAWRNKAPNRVVAAYDAER